ncbi:hypothetical protein GCM10009834_20570 [Streptomonospora arabica]|uniref:Uncharacterized protein n=1 Tax=Streptomonospora halophila TaxID=427369 RepID=A0ABP9GI72_9ACTN
MGRSGGDTPCIGAPVRSRRIRVTQGTNHCSAIISVLGTDWERSDSAGTIGPEESEQ